MSDERYINEIIVHCSATPPEMEVDVDLIRKWHTDPVPDGNGWSDIGYHFVVLRDGTVQEGRPIERSGAHCRGRNSHSIGICLVGGVDADLKPEFNFTSEQAQALRELIDSLQAGIPHNVSVSGHRDHDSHKDCPCFDVKQWWSGRWEG